MTQTDEEFEMRAMERAFKRATDAEAALETHRESARLAEVERARIREVIANVRAEAAAYRDEHGENDGENYASGLLSAALDVEEALG